ncbi:hypothetical protein Sjap_021192 [Stephania japonica]|uniref:Oligopeptide transporter n=1 Tax=Stephania japonica TaxID=461633 RepID=A0AAP0F7B5_9MAGN
MAAALDPLHIEESSETENSPVKQVENSPVKQVALTVPPTDDASLPALTFRMWVLGVVSCVLLSVLNQFFWFRNNPLSISSISAQIAVVPLGHFMARVITKRKFLKGTRFEFSLNPGPFNVKEHVLITIFANAGAGSVYAMHILSAVKLFYKRKMDFFVSFIIMLTTQMIGFGYAGLFRRYLVEPAEMWWPNILVQVSLFMALHDKDKRRKGQLTRTQFFLIVFICSFAYYLLPGYLFVTLTSISFVCWIFPKSVLGQQIGSGSTGIGLGSFGLDWSTAASYLGSPLASPWFATVNVACGFFIFMYIITPIAYWINLYRAKNFPFYSNHLYTANGERYDVASITDSKFNLDLKAYLQTGPIYISTMFAMSYGIGFGSLPATLVHTFLFYGKEIWQLSTSAVTGKKKDIHTRLMEKYSKVPQWWFLVILAVNATLALLAVFAYKEQVQLPWWGLLLALAIGIIYILPIGILTATTAQAPGLNVITEYIIGYIIPGLPVANMCFKVYGYISMVQGLSFLSDFKLGHYMKIPPKSMFMAQVLGTLIATIVYLATAWWLMESIPHLCDPANLPEGSPWTCPMDTVFYDASVLWGLIGPRRIFGPLGTYGAMNWGFLVGAIAPIIVWLLHKAYPEKKWIPLINMPVVFSATGMIPPASAVNYTTWIILAFISGFLLFRYQQDWWRRHNYVLSGGLDAGLAFMGVVQFVSLGSISIDWWGNGRSCPLAACPTAKGVVTKGCPTY